MTRAARERNATLPVSRNHDRAIAAAQPNRDTCIPLSADPVELSGYSGRKGRSNGQHVGMWGTLSQNYKTTVTIDTRWSHTRKDHDA